MSHKTIAVNLVLDRGSFQEPVSTVLKRSLVALDPALSSKGIKDILRFYDQFKVVKSPKEFSAVRDRFLLHVFSAHKGQTLVIQDLVKQALALKHGSSSKPLPRFYSRSTIDSSFETRSYLSLFGRELQAQVNKHARRFDPVTFLSKAADQTVIQERGILPRPKIFAHKDMVRLIAQRSPERQSAQPMHTVRCFNSKGESLGLNALTVALNSLKGCTVMTGLLVNHDAEIHWDGLLVLGNTVYHHHAPFPYDRPSKSIFWVGEESVPKKTLAELGSVPTTPYKGNNEKEGSVMEAYTLQMLLSESYLLSIT